MLKKTLTAAVAAAVLSACPGAGRRDHSTTASA